MYCNIIIYCLICAVKQAVALDEETNCVVDYITDAKVSI